MSLRGRIILVAIPVLLFGFLSLNNFIDDDTRLASPLLPDEGMRLGLDLRGGIHWVLGVKLEAAVEHELEFLEGSLEAQVEEDEITLERLAVESGRLVVEPFAASDAEAVREWAVGTTSLRIAEDGDERLEFVLNDRQDQTVRERGMRQVLEVLRRRIADPVKGIPESVVTRQGSDRILVQIPGGELERTAARELLRVTGFLEFKMVRDVAQTEELLRAKYDELPEDTEIVFERDPETQRALVAYLVPRKADLTGDNLTDARVTFDAQQRPVVSFTFNANGGRLFGELTQAHIGDQLAIVLDELVYSAPVIRSRIGSRGQIEGRFTSQQAADLSVILRSGSLSVPVEIEEERTVGPTLGADSIERGVRASMAGLIVIILFVVGYYRLSGVYASLALLANLLLLIGIMSMFGATLTLPGLAGIVLTVGMAVDANVIIFERIREELRAAKTPRAAIATGFNKALWTILDANITTLITALVLFEFGTGPIKGFAVTLSIGVVTSVFAALVITRLMFAIYPGNRHLESLSI